MLLRFPNYLLLSTCAACRDDDAKSWIAQNGRDHRRPLSLLKPFPAAFMKAHDVSPLVKSPQNDLPICAEPVGASHDRGTQGGI